MIRHYIVDSANNNCLNTSTFMTKLHVIHDAGFFSCSTIALMDIITYINTHGQPPDHVDRSRQYLSFKSKPGDDIIKHLFTELPIDDLGGCKVPIPLPYDCMSIQFDAYSKLPFEAWQPIVEAWFSPSVYVSDKYEQLINEYLIDVSKACAVFYRGNDKKREMEIAGYQVFVDKCGEILRDNPDVQFVVLPDEIEFMTAMHAAFPGRCVTFTQTPAISKQDSAVFYQVPHYTRSDYSSWYLASVLVLARCKHVVTHSGNGGLWLALYRSNTQKLHQWFNHSWM